MGISPILNSQLFLRILRFSNPEVERNEPAETLLIETNNKGPRSENTFVWVKASGGKLDVKPSTATVDSTYTKFDLSDGFSLAEANALGANTEIIKAFKAVARGTRLEGYPVASGNNLDNIDDSDLEDFWKAICSLSIANRWTTEQALFALLTIFSDPQMKPERRDHKARHSRFTAIEAQLETQIELQMPTNQNDFIKAIKSVLGILDVKNPVIVNLESYIKTQKLDVTKEADRKQAIKHISAMAAATSWPVDFQKKHLGFVAPFTPDKKAQYDEPSFNLGQLKVWAGQFEQPAITPPIAPPVVPPPPPVMGPPAPTEQERAYHDALAVLGDEAIKDLGQPKDFDELAKALASSGCDGYKAKLVISNPKPEDLISAAKHYREFFVYEPKADRQLSVNTTERHYFIEGLSREEGETQLQKRVDGAMVEEGWIYVEYKDASGVSHKRWYETGTEQDLAAVYVKTHIIEKLLAQKAKISHVGHYHIHPGYASEMAKRSNKTALNMPSEDDFSTFEFTALRVKSNGYSGPVNFNVITSDGRFTVNLKMDDPKFKDGFAKTIKYAREAAAYVREVTLQEIADGKRAPQPDPSVRERKLTNEGVDVTFTLSPVRFSRVVMDVASFFAPNNLEMANRVEQDFASLRKDRKTFEEYFALFFAAFKEVVTSLPLGYKALFKSAEMFLFVSGRYNISLVPARLGEAYGRYVLISKEVCGVFKGLEEKYNDDLGKFNEINRNHVEVFHGDLSGSLTSTLVPLLPHILDYFSKEKAAATKAALIAIITDPQKGKKLSDAVKTQDVSAIKALLDAEINPKPAAPVPSPAPSLDEVISSALLRLAESDPKLIAFMARVPEGQREALRNWMLAERCVEFKPSGKISGDKDAAKRHFSQALEGKDLDAPEWKWMQKAKERLLKIKHSEHTSRINLAKRTGYSEQVLARFEELTDASVNATVFKSGDNEYFQALDAGFQIFGLRKVIKSPKGQDVIFFETFGPEASLGTINERIRATKQRLMEIGDAYKTFQERGFGYHVELHEENFRTYLTYDNSLLSSFRAEHSIIPKVQIIIDGNNFHIKFPLSESAGILTKPFPLSSATPAEVDAEIKRIIDERNRPVPATAAPVAPVEAALDALGALDSAAPARPSRTEPPRSAPPAPVPPPAGPAIVPPEAERARKAAEAAAAVETAKQARIAKAEEDVKGTVDLINRINVASEVALMLQTVELQGLIKKIKDKAENGRDYTREKVALDRKAGELSGKLESKLMRQFSAMLAQAEKIITLFQAIAEQSSTEYKSLESDIAAAKDRANAQSAAFIQAFAAKVQSAKTKLFDIVKARVERALGTPAVAKSEHAGSLRALLVQLSTPNGNIYQQIETYLSVIQPKVDEILQESEMIKASFRWRMAQYTKITKALKSFNPAKYGALNAEAEKLIEQGADEGMKAIEALDGRIAVVLRELSASWGVQINPSNLLPTVTRVPDGVDPQAIRDLLAEISFRKFDSSNPGQMRGKIRQIVTKDIPVEAQIKALYDKKLKRNPGLEGRIILQVQLNSAEGVMTIKAIPNDGSVGRAFVLKIAPELGDKLGQFFDNPDENDLKFKSDIDEIIKKQDKSLQEKLKRLVKIAKSEEPEFDEIIKVVGDIKLRYLPGTIPDFDGNIQVPILLSGNGK